MKGSLPPSSSTTFFMRFAADTPGTAYMAPVILANVSRDMRVMREETFGPVMPVMAVDGDDEAIRHINDSRYGLTSSVWTTRRGF